MARVSGRGSESVVVGGASLPARHLVITMAAGGERHVWVDTQGRVLRVEIPARSFVAMRIAAPK
jgi:N-methylhydantoinase A/oxoprolinase/acetone carboxylase beta subunit